MSTVGAVVVGCVLVMATVAGAWWRRRQGALRLTRAADAGSTAVTPHEIGVALGERATLLQFSSAFCRPCVATRRVLTDAAAALPGVAHVDIDAESRLDLVRRLRISSTPTTVLLDAAGVERRRAGGVPRKHEVIAALADITSE